MSNQGARFEVFRNIKPGTLTYKYPVQIIVKTKKYQILVIDKLELSL